MTRDPHGHGLMRTQGVALEEASGVVILLHGRGGSAQDILSLGQGMYFPRLAYLAPEAAGNSWYPNSFLAPVADNEPWLSSALRRVASVIELAERAGVPAKSIVLCGFSQGACLATEFIARHPRQYAGLIAFTGGLIGPPGSDLTHEGNLADMPALLSSGDPDAHVPWQRVRDSATILTGMGARVTLKRYPGRAHTVSAQEIEAGRDLIRERLASADTKV